VQPTDPSVHALVKNPSSAAHRASLPSLPVHTYVVRVWVPDRPGALGQVASRIGAVHGDVIGIDILERGAGMAIDELVVTLPSDHVVDLLVAEIGEVDGVAVEEIRSVAADRPESAIVALEIAARFVELEPHKLLDGVCREIRDFLEANWVVAMSPGGLELLVELGEAPAIDWLGAFIVGSRHLEPAQQHLTAPHDLAWASLPGHDVAIVAGRSRAFRARERQQFDVFGRIAGGLLRPGA